MVLEDGQSGVVSGRNVVEVEGLEFSYGRNKAVNKLSFSVGRGDILGLIGKNGAGKTTTIHLLLGFLRYRKGSIRVLGLDPKRENIKILDRCGLFPEQGEPYEWMRVKHLYRLGRYSYRNWDGQLCEKLCEQLELDSHKRIRDLSRGMLIKAKLIFALSHRPKILILDEPTNGLDPLSRYDILNIVKLLSVEHNVTVMISSHNLDEIAEIATHICMVDKGKNVLAESMDAIRSRFGLLEVPLGMAIPKGLEVQVIKSRTKAGKTQHLLRDKTTSELAALLEKSAGEDIELKDIGLKELFIFITRNL